MHKDFNMPNTAVIKHRFRIECRRWRRAFSFRSILLSISALIIILVVPFTISKLHKPGQEVGAPHRILSSKYEESLSGSTTQFTPQVIAAWFLKSFESIGGFTFAPILPRTSLETYDYIVVGGGAAGCPLAYTLSAAGFSVLLLERGPKRSYSTTPRSMDIYGSGMVLNDPTVSQRVMTTQGVHTHIGSVMGGGTSINMAIYIKESQEYFQHLQNTFPNVQWDLNLVDQASQWATEKVAAIAPQEKGGRTRIGLEHAGFVPLPGNSTGSTVPTSDQLQTDNYWGSYSLFNESNFFVRNAADTLLEDENGTPPATLRILTGHTVEKIQFREANGTNDPEAACVMYRKSAKDDSSPLSNALFNNWRIGHWTTWFLNLVSPSGTFGDSVRQGMAILFGQLNAACVKSDGEIILSAGAIPSTQLLYKSGVGPKSQIDVLGIPRVREIEQLGQNFSDRVFIPAAVFIKEEFSNLRKPYLPPMVSPLIGMKLQGPNCSDFSIGDRSLTCSLSTFESLVGARISEGLAYATRFVFPPEWRDHPFTDFLFSSISTCSTLSEAYSDTYLGPICKILNPVQRCFRRSFAVFYFTSEPKSRGSIKMNKDGGTEVDSRYLHDTQDLFDAIRGTSNLLEVVNSDAYKDLIEPFGPLSCPITILNGLLTAVLEFGSLFTSSRPSALDNLNGVKEHLEGLLRDANQAFRSQDDSSNPGEPPSVPLYRADKKLDAKDAIKSIPPAVRSELERHWRQISKDFAPLQDAPNVDGIKHASNIQSPLQAESSYPICQPSDPYHYFVSKTRRFNTGRRLFHNCAEAPTRAHAPLSGSASEDSMEATLSAEDASASSSEKKASLRATKTTGVEAEQLNLQGFLTDAIGSASRTTAQWAATYPPLLPDSNNPVALAKYALTYMASVWHHAGTTAMGSVVNSNFTVKGLSRISVVDAGVLNQIPRINPTATVLMLGRYAGLLKLRERGLDISTL